MALIQVYQVIINYYKNKNWLQFLFIVKAAVLKQQISKFYPQIQRTEAFAVLLGEIGEVDNVAYNSTFAYSVYGTFGTNRPCIKVYGLCSMADFQFFKMTAVRHLGFAKVGNFNFRSGLEAHCASYAKFREDTLNRSGDIADFRFFKTAAAAILDFEKFHIFNGWDAQKGRMHRMPNFVEIAQNAAEIWRFFTFSNF